jgi:ankyrin repeat protein
MAQLHVGLISKKRTRRDIISSLEELPEELDGVYDDIMSRIRSQERDDVKLATRILEWITFAKEPLKDIMIQHAVATVSKGTDIEDDDLILVDELISTCAGMVTLDRESGIIRLVHYTTQKYLESKLPEAQYNIATTCLTYLGLSLFRNTPGIGRTFKKYPLCSYALRNWIAHSRGVAEDSFTTAVLGTFRTYENRLWFSAYDCGFRTYSNRLRNNSDILDMSLLYFLARFGLSTVCRRLLFGKAEIDGMCVKPPGKAKYSSQVPIDSADIDARDGAGRTPLMTAARFGQENVIEVLLEAGANIEAADPDGFTALWWATKVGALESMKVLIAAGADMENRREGWYLLATTRFPPLLKGLLGRLKMEAKTEARRTGQTVLMLSAQTGLAESVRLLIDARANIEAEDGNKVTALCHAARNGHQEVVKLLLDAGANIEGGQSYYRRSALGYAAMEGHTEIVKLLLNANATTEITDGRTPLEWAKERGHADIVSLLEEAN